MDDVQIGKIQTVLRIGFCLLTLPYFLLESIIKSIFSQPKCIKGNIVVVTGAGNGLGREMCLQLAQLGSIVLCVDMKKDDLDETVKKLHELQGTKECAQGYVCDISDRKAVEKLHADIIEEFGHVDILFNNAAVVYPSILSDSTQDNIERVVNVNILGTVWMTQVFLSEMKRREKGQIVFTSSIGAVMYLKQFTIYSMTKAALTGLVHCINNELNGNHRWRNIVLSIAHPTFINSNNFIEKTLASSWPPLKVNEAAKMLIEGARRNYYEYSIPGYQFGLTLLKITRCLPWRFTELVKDSMKVDFKQDCNQTFLSDFMSTKSQKIVLDENNYTLHSRER